MAAIWWPEPVPPGSTDELLNAAAVEIAAAVRRRTVSAREVVEAYLAQIESRNPRINAIVTMAPDPVGAAQRVDNELARGRDPGPLAGVPLTVKDTLATSNVRTTAGSRTLAAFVPRATATAVRRLEAAGAVLVGKTNTPEFALDLHTDNSLFGPTLNPRDERRTPGGSSGGESAALAAGFSALGIGTDFGASIRWPAQCTGVVGLRPTVGAVPSTGSLPYFTKSELAAPDPASFLGATQVVGPMARDVRDLALAIGVLAGPDGIDPGVRPDPPPPSRGQAPLDELRCAWFASEGTYPVCADVESAVAQAAGGLAALGIEVVSRRPSAIADAEPVYDRLRAADNASFMTLLPTDASGRRPPSIEAAIDVSASWSAADRRRDLAVRLALRASLAEFMREHPILLCPVSSIPAFDAGQQEFAVAGEDVPRMRVVACSRAIGLFGLPSVSVPCAIGGDGSVVSVQVVGRPCADHEALAVAHALARQFSARP